MFLDEAHSARAGRQTFNLRDGVQLLGEELITVLPFLLLLSAGCRVLPRRWAILLAWVATALLFGAYHWWTGPWNALAAMATGTLLMQLYRRANVLWPAVVAHYCIDLFIFGLW